jgi:predicted metal-dependent peptidase
MKWLLPLLLVLSQKCYAQIEIPDVGDGWKGRTLLALDRIHKYDSSKYHTLLSVCNKIEFWTGSFATTDKQSILIPTTELKVGIINDLAAILIHESMHLYLKAKKIQPTVSEEERLCYEYELDFLQKIPGVESWLLNNCKQQIETYSYGLYK